ncbi:snaclec subunit B-like [Elgaria multicarinata webbii]|uniref:snaclec subunit B-like n=1 Tax=Elgaria multicarinata webbii TaxID=159646 RepID=UPI002FCD4FCC
MRSWLPFCAILLTFFISDACSQTCLCAHGFCQTGWVQYKDACYKAVMERKNWNEAEMGCLSYGRNSHLASIHSAEENDFIFHLMGKPLNYVEGKAYWIGAHDLFQEGSFTWTDGSEFDYKIFPPNQPDGLAGEHYLGSWILQNGFVTWNDYDVSWRFPSVCKYYLGNSWKQQQQRSFYESCANFCKVSQDQHEFLQEPHEVL